jgi:hypothetical protein
MSCQVCSLDIRSHLGPSLHAPLRYRLGLYDRPAVRDATVGVVHVLVRQHRRVRRDEPPVVHAGAADPEDVQLYFRTRTIPNTNQIAGDSQSIKTGRNQK